MNEENLTDEAADKFREVLGTLMVSMTSKEGRDAALCELAEVFHYAEVMLKGLPKLIDAVAELGDKETLALAKGQLARFARAEGADPEELSDASAMFDVLHSKLRILTNSIRTLAKGQLALAEQNRNMASLLAAYVVSGEASTHAAKAAIKLGKGDEALRALAKAKFGGA